MARYQLKLNEHMVPAGRGDTVLAAALAQGVALPNRCRVGGCGTCKCRIVSGQVHQRTDPSYLLTAEELDAGVVLACQSEPRSDLVVAFTPAADSAPMTGAQVVAHTRLRPDASLVQLALDPPVLRQPGQHVRVRFAGLPDVARTFSPADHDPSGRRMRLLIRHVPGGRLGQWLETTDLTGMAAAVSAPAGTFGWTEGTDPAVLVVTGTGLAPILSMLEAMRARGVVRPVTLIQGARTEADLLLRDKLDALAAGWLGSFRYVPVLSAPDGAWAGARGHVDEVVAAHATEHAEFWICGQPAMVESVQAELARRGIPPPRCHVDRFDLDPVTPRPRTAERPVATLFDYLKFVGFHGIGLIALASLLAGGSATVLGLFGVLGAYIIGDFIAGDDTRTPEYRHPGLLTGALWMALPLLMAIVFVAVWTVAPGDPLGFGAWAGGLLGHDLLAARDASGFGVHVAGLFLTGLMIGLVGTIAAHELTHRTWDRVSMAIGRWLLAFSGDTAFAIEHVHGHHRTVATHEDPASAPRGRNVYAHVLLSTILGNRSAWRLEAARLARVRLPVWSWHNRYLRGQAMTLALLAAAAALGGWIGALYFLGCAAWGKALLEIVNYMEHYGLVREPGAPVEPRHSWNTNRRVSSWTMFQLTRHSHHHAEGEVPFQDLEPYPEAPVMVQGYLTTILLTLVPPLWFTLMAPKLRDWDARFANAAERRLVAESSE